MLDNADFEVFETYTYEQLLIIYTKERLQQLFNLPVLVLEQDEYAREDIEWKHENLGLVLQPTIDLIESSGSAIGILSCQDEECMPKPNDTTFTQKLHHLVPEGEEARLGRTKYPTTRFEQGFIVQHYAGSVEYRIQTAG